jgi:hypothetical protein
VPSLTTEQNKALSDVLAAVSCARDVGVTENHIIRAIQKMEVSNFLSALDALSKSDKNEISTSAH